MRLSGLAVLTLAGVACVAGGPGGGNPAPTETPETVVGRVPLRAAWLTTGADTMLISRTGPASAVAYRLRAPAFVGGVDDSPDRVVIGSTVEVLRRVRNESGRWMLELDFEQRDGDVLSTRTTTWVDASTLLPVRQRALLDEGRVVTLLYGGGRVVTVDAAPGRPVTGASATIRDSVYSAAALDLVLRALPLEAGFHATVPLYFPADEIVFPLDVRVTGVEQITTRAGNPAICWLVSAVFPGNITEHFWIDQHSHALLRILAHESETSLVRYDR